jgi:hypothetical protein
MGRAKYDMVKDPFDVEEHNNGTNEYRYNCAYDVPAQVLNMVYERHFAVRPRVVSVQETGDNTHSGILSKDREVTSRLRDGCARAKNYEHNRKIVFRLRAKRTGPGKIKQAASVVACSLNYLVDL